MLVQFGMVVFGILAIMSLVIDMGYVTLTRVQMQNAADSAAREGIRLRDKYTTDGYASDCERRLAARDIARYTFDDDFAVDDSPSSDDDDPEWAFGAGPVMQLDGGEGDLNAHALIHLQERRRDRVYKPRLALNRAGDPQNLEYGDLVSGNFTYSNSPEHSEGPRTSNPQAPPYNRNDFSANNSPPQPDPAWGAGYADCPDPPVGQPVPPWPDHDPGYSGTTIADDAFLVRLRRTNNKQGLDAIDGVSSSERALPLVWGLGSTIKGDNVEPNTYPVRREGFVVRGTAIARTAPTMRVGLPHPNARGATPFVLRRSFYDSTLNDTFQDFGVSANGEIKIGATTVGLFTADPTSCVEPGPANHDRCTVGSIPPDPSPFACAAAAAVDANRSVYGPVYDLMVVSGNPKIIGFGWVNWTLNCATSAVSLRKRDLTTVGTDNTTGHLFDGLPPMTSQDLIDLQCSICTFSGVQACQLSCPPHDPSIAVLSPVLAR